MFINTRCCDNNISLSQLLSQAESNYFLGSLVSTRAGFWRVFNLWAKPELEVIEAAEPGLGGCFMIEDIVREDVVL